MHKADYFEDSDEEYLDSTEKQETSPPETAKPDYVDDSEEEYLDSIEVQDISPKMETAEPNHVDDIEEEYLDSLEYQEISPKMGTSKMDDSVDSNDSDEVLYLDFSEDQETSSKMKMGLKEVYGQNNNGDTIKDMVDAFFSHITTEEPSIFEIMAYANIVLHQFNHVEMCRETMETIFENHINSMLARDGNTDYRPENTKKSPAKFELFEDFDSTDTHEEEVITEEEIIAEDSGNSE